MQENILITLGLPTSTVSFGDWPQYEPGFDERAQEKLTLGLDETLRQFRVRVLAAVTAKIDKVFGLDE
jgi:hypothetical protein